MKYFDSMQRFSVAAKKSKDVVQRLYDASKHLRQYNEAFYLQQQLQHSQQQQQSPPQGFSDMASSMEVFNMARRDQPPLFWRCAWCDESYTRPGCVGS